MDPELQELLRKIAETNEALAGAFARLNDTPTVVRQDAAVGIADQSAPLSPVRRALNFEEKSKLRSELRKLSTAELLAFLGSQIQNKQAGGIPLYTWLNAGGYAAQQLFDGGIQHQVDPDVMKAIDTGGAAALIRQDLEPVLYELYVRQFPFYEEVGKEPANGLVHAWNQITGFGDAAFMSELGTVTDDQSAYTRKTTNVAILATRRGVSLKSQFAVIAGGAGYNPEMLELQGGLRAMAHKMQVQIFSGQSTVTGGTSTTEEGAYDANAFNGLRYELGIVQNNAKNVDPATNPTTTGNVRRAIDAAIIDSIQNGGDAGALQIWSHPVDKQTWDEQQDPNVRIMEAAQRGAGVGVVANAVNTIEGPIPWRIVRGDSIGSYNAGSNYAGTTSVRDVYLVQPSAITMPFLGTEGPTVLEIPIGISGQLTKLYVVFQMAGLALKALTWHNKVRVKLA